LFALVLFLVRARLLDKQLSFGKNRNLLETLIASVNDKAIEQ
jgi:hypothetical protein